MKLSTATQRLPKLIDPHGINLILGTKDYSLLLVPLQSASPAPDGLTTDPPRTDTTRVKEAAEREGSYLFAILTIHTFTGWQDMTPADWGHKVVRLLEADQADHDLIHAFMEDIIPGTIGEAWQVVRCNPDDPVPYDGGRVVLIGDAAHAMPPQA
jgi:2-polyprenyl-6-methoxyphenol hydroxylase-like FAD-dependent oxidoreductase